ncbi:restriction endonuclease subunit S [Streptococcus thermophilus]|uniref:restriction endonuclease subunit S n=1 Tax=Streptococcus thermophilus TaxID=1308 RepID=UPI002620918C|nr:restriction endonuclease subunit S [Streptococcus thermophilus]
MTNSKHVPKRRFKEFESDGEWEFSRFGEVVVRVSESMMNSSFPNVEYEDVIPGKGQLNKNIHGKTNNKKGIRFLEGDVLYGKLRPYLKNWLLSDFKGIAVGDWWVLRSSELDSKFLYNFIQTEKYQVVANRSTGTKMPRSDWETVKDSDILFPSNFEQKKLGDFFQTIDSLISLHQHKLDKLKNLKKAYLAELFPVEGEQVPKRRFPGFEGEWEMTTLGETVKVTMGQSPDGTTYSDAPGDYILVQGNSDIENGWVKPRIWTTQITKSAEEGDIIMSVRAPAGQVGRTEYNVVIGRGVAAIKGNEFIYQLLVKLDIDAYWKQVSSGSTFDSLNSDNIKNAEIKVPSFEEQEKIGEFFHKLDNSITLQQQKLDKLNDLKKAYLNELFV